MLKFLLDFSLSEVISDTHDLMTPNIYGKISGEESKNISLSIKKLSEKDKLMRVLKLFF
jgi:hypothetical protein